MSYELGKIKISDFLIFRESSKNYDPSVDGLLFCGIMSYELARPEF